MRFRDILIDANNNLRRSKVRTFLTVSAVFVGAFTLALTNGVGDGIKQYINAQLGNAGSPDILFVLPKGDDQKTKDANGGLSEYNPDRTKNTTAVNGPSGESYLVENDVQKIQKIDGVSTVYRTYSLTPEFMTTGDKKFSVSVDQNTEGTNLQLESGRLVNNGSENEITIPKNYVSPLGLGSYSDAIGKKVTFGFKDSNGELFTKDGVVVGVQSNTLLGSSSINVSSVLAKEVQERQLGDVFTKTPRYVFLLARFDSSKGVDHKKTVVKEFADLGYEAKTFSDQLGIISTVLNAVTLGLNLFGAIALLAASFGIINTLYIAVQERTKEIGLMKALGMSKSKIFSLFSIEAILIGFWGSLLGVMAANGVGILLNNLVSGSQYTEHHVSA